MHPDTSSVHKKDVISQCVFFSCPQTEMKKSQKIQNSSLFYFFLSKNKPNIKMKNIQIKVGKFGFFKSSFIIFQRLIEIEDGKGCSALYHVIYIPSKRFYFFPLV